LFERVCWLDALPEQFSGAVVANEVLDALPVHLVYWRDSALAERGVVVQGEGFAWAERDIMDAALREAAQKIVVPDDYVSEIGLAARGLIQSLASRLQSGALLFIDYGFGAREFYHAQRNKGTLMCHYRHHAHDDPFYLPGLQDITAHVNFTDVAEAGIDAGLSLIGYTNQAFFLINGGITELLAQHDPEQLRDYLPLSAQLQKLTSPAEMGDLFKVIALGKGMDASLSGFSRGDLSRAL
jgi:SAM-dependent MidA family methyltransferase